MFATGVEDANKRCQLVSTEGEIKISSHTELDHVRALFVRHILGEGSKTVELEVSADPGHEVMHRHPDQSSEVQRRVETMED
jgi:hypothetical protein